MTADQGGDPPCWAGLVEDHRDRRDLATRSEVHDLVTRFYREVVFDELLEPIFGEVAEVDWADHIPRLIDYWCWILFGADGYPGSVTRAHRRVHGLQPIEPVHCDRWMALWVATIDAGWAGPVADHAKDHAARLMAGMAKHVFGFAWAADAAATAGATPSGSARSG